MSISLETLALAKKYTDEHGGGSSGETTDYSKLTNKPTINGVEVSGNKTSADYKIEALPDAIEEDNGKILEVSDGQWVKNEPVCGYVYTNYSNDNIALTDMGGGLKIGPTSFSLTILPDKKYKIVFNNDVYDCTSILLGEYYLLGNASIVGEAENTGEPFLILGEAIYTNEQIDSCSLYIYGPSIKQLDDVFIKNPIVAGTGENSNIFNSIDQNEASGDYSHAEGYGTTASGDVSHAEGNNTIAYGQNSHAQGKWNIADESNTYAHIVGNGSSKSVRSNAHTLSWKGDTWYAGELYLGGTGQDDPNAWKANLPKYTSSDEGKILKIVDGVPTWVSLQSAEEVSF